MAYDLQSWLPDLAEALAGLRTQEDDVSEIVPDEQLFELRQKLTALRQSGDYSRWVRWFFTDGQSKGRSDLFGLASGE